MESTKHSEPQIQKAIVLLAIFGLILTHMGLVTYIEELKEMWTTKRVPDDDVDTFLWVQLPSFIGVLSGIAGAVYRKSIIGWLMVASGCIIMYPNLLVTSSWLTFFGGTMYLISGAIVLLNKKI